MGGVLYLYTYIASVLIILFIINLFVREPNPTHLITNHTDARGCVV